MEGTLASSFITPPPSQQHKTLRIRGIPLSYDIETLQLHLSHTTSGKGKGKGKDRGILAIKSLAKAAALDSQVATLDVDYESPILRDQRSDQWTLHTQDDILDTIDLVPGSLSFDTHFRGLTPLHTASTADGSNTLIDIVAISGLGGHAFGSFKERGGPHMWLRDTLKHKVPTANIWIYGFDSKVQKSDSMQNIDDIANGLVSSLDEIVHSSAHSAEANKSPAGPQRLILIGHSLGGLVIKQALIRLDDKSSLNSTISDALCALFFFGVPSHGMAYESLLAMSEGGPNELLLYSLHPNSEILRTQRERFKQCAALRQCEIYCFYETRQSPTAKKDHHSRWVMNGPKTHLVTHASATDHIGGSHYSTYTHPIEATHSEMVKFRPHDENADFVFHLLAKVISKTLLEDNIAQIEHDTTSSQEKSFVRRDPWSMALYEDPHAMRTLISRISDYDRERAHRRLSEKRVRGTVEWFVQDPKVQKWLGDSNNSSLWCSGDIGSGKTMICTGLIDYLRSQTGQVGMPLVFFYCETLEYKTTRATYLMCSLVRQIFNILIQSRNDCSEVVKTKIKHFFGTPGSDPNLSDMIDIFDLVQRRLPRCCYIIDGLDELEPKDLSQIIAFLNSFFKKSSFGKVFIASRVQLDFKAQLNPRFSIHISSLNTKTDMGNFIESEISRKMAEERVLTDNPQVLHQVKEALLSKANGMFLWARLQIEALWLDCINDDQVLTALENLPTDLKTTYDRCVRRALATLANLRDRDKGLNIEDLTAKALRWLACARRPLHISELQEAVSYSFTDTQWNPYQTISSSVLRGACANLISTEVSGTVRLTHPSVKQYLLDSELDFPGVITNERQANLRCGEECVHYLTFSDFKLQIAPSRPAFVPIPPPMNVIDSMPYSGFVKWVRNPLSLPTSSIQKTQVVKMPRPIQAQEEEKYKFLGYAREFWAEHTQSISEESEKWNQFCDLALQPNTSWGLHPWISSGQSQISHLHGLLIWASREGHIPLLSILIGEGDLSEVKEFCNIPSVLDRLPALHIAAKKGHLNTIRLLMKVCNVNVLDDEAQTVLHHCAKANHIQVANEILSRTSIKISSVSKNNETALGIACSLGSQEMVALLIGYGADAQPKRYVPSNPFIAAARNGHSEIVEMLLSYYSASKLSKGVGIAAFIEAIKNGHDSVVKLLAERDDVDADSKDESGRTPLSYTAREGHDSVVKLLTERDDVDADSKDESGRTPLSYAAWEGHDSVVKLLTERNDVDADSKDEFGRTPLSYAAWEGHDSVVKLLTERNDVDADSKDEFGRTPLSYAARVGHYSVVKLLTERDDVDADSNDIFGWTPLSMTALEGHYSVVKLLTERNDVDADSKGPHGRTPLFFAALKGHDLIVKLLTERNDVNADSKDRSGWTPLSMAAREGHYSVVKLLVGEGARSGLRRLF